MKHTVIDILFTILGFLTDLELGGSSRMEYIEKKYDICVLHKFANILQSTSHLEGKGDEDIENLLSVLSNKDIEHLYKYPKYPTLGCGVFGTSPKLSLMKLSCDQLQDTIFATREALVRFSLIKKKFFEKNFYDNKGNINEDKQVELSVIWMMGSGCKKSSKSCDRERRYIKKKIRYIKSVSHSKISSSQEYKKIHDWIKNKISKCL
jgi:hypothetical protein